MLPLTADLILFDIDAVVSGFASINYQIVPDVATADSETQDGTMADIVGSDLFGDTGSNYAHWQTKQEVSVVSDNNAVDLTITTGYVQSRHTDGLHTYLAFGDAAPITVVVPLPSN